MRINAKRIPPEGERLQGTEPASIMELDEDDVRFEHEIVYDVLAQVQGRALLVTGKLEARATFQCSRCLRMFERLVRVGNFVVHQELHGEDFVDLTDNVREDIILELPQRALCGPECRGLCPQCGKNLNEGACRCAPASWGAPWAALDKLKPE
jgi:uncharacterized protein